MAFPITHLCVAGGMLEHVAIELQDQFVLGSIAPDAVHFRKQLMGSDALKSELGPAKKVTHLCPVSDERWGQVTNNDAWIESVKKFLSSNLDNPFALGYAVHVLTDIYNNKGLWKDFITKYPQEAMKGYDSGYYQDLRAIDMRIYADIYENSRAHKLLACATPVNVPGLVVENELAKIQHNLLHVQYANVKSNTPVKEEYQYVTYKQMLEFIDGAVQFCLANVSCYSHKF